MYNNLDTDLPAYNYSISNTLRRTLLNERKIYLWSQVDDDSSKDIVEQLSYLEAIDAGKPIHMYINCPGGIVTSGFAMHDMMQAISSPVYTYCLGFAASMGSVLLSAGEKGHRYIYPMAEVMIHQPSGGSYQAPFKDLEINAKHIMRTKELIGKILADNCGQAYQKVMKDFDRDYWMNAEEAMEYGIVDSIITP